MKTAENSAGEESVSGQSRNKASGRTAKGQFASGNSGNPSGRPKSESANLRARLTVYGPAVAQVVLKAALNGDLQACKLVLERISPALKPQAEMIKVDLPLSNDSTAIARAVIAATAEGKLSPDVATQMVAAIGTLTRVVEAGDLKARLESIERAIKVAKR